MILTSPTSAFLLNTGRRSGSHEISIAASSIYLYSKALRWGSDADICLVELDPIVKSFRDRCPLRIVSRLQTVQRIYFSPRYLNSNYIGFDKTRAEQ
jgi:hypothetical protein